MQNNGWGISTSYKGQHGETHIIDRGKAFNMDTLLLDGNDPIAVYKALEQKMHYVRTNRRPVLIEALVSRLYGHSSASGANYVSEEPCPIALFEKKLKKNNLLTDKEQKDIWESLKEQAKQEQQEVKKEADPDPKSIWDHVYANNENANWRTVRPRIGESKG